MKNHGHSDVSEKRTPGSVFKLKPREDEPFCEESITDKPNKKGVTYVKKNVAGVNHHQLLDVDPARSVIPSLHCEMGNCNKLIKDMQDFLLLYAEPLEDVNDKMVRQLFLDSMKEEQEAELDLERNETIKAKKKAKDAKSKRVFWKKYYGIMQSERKRAKGGLQALLDAIFLSVGGNREYYHGGTFDGGSVRNMMGKADAMFAKIWEHIESIHNRTECMSRIEIKRKLDKYAMAMSLLDIVWSSVRGPDGLLPDAAFLARLETDIVLAKNAWIAAGLNIAGNPKAHMNFDGHLLRAVIRYGGIADKLEDWIEKDHQKWKKQQQLTWQMKDFKQQQVRQLKNIRLAENTQVVRLATETNKLRERNTKRKREGKPSLKEEKEHVKTEAKKERRDIVRVAATAQAVPD